jgi:hypothetical protein
LGIRAEIGQIRAEPIPRHTSDRAKRGFVPAPRGRGQYETWRETSALRPQPATKPSYGSAEVRLSLGSAGFDAERGSQPLPGRAEAAPKGGSGGLRPLR